MDIYTAIRCIVLYVVFPWLVVRYCVHKAFGVYVTYINPFRLKIAGINIKGKIYVEYLQLSILERKVVVGGFHLLKKSEGHKTLLKNDEDEKPRFQVPRWLLNRVGTFSQLLNDSKILFFDLRLEDMGITFKNLHLNIKYDGLKGKYTISVFMLRFKWQEELIYEDALFIFKTKLDTEKINNGNPFHSTALDFKIGDLNIPASTFIRQSIGKDKLFSDRDACANVNYDSCKIDASDCTNKNINNSEEQSKRKDKDKNKSEIDGKGQDDAAADRDIQEDDMGCGLKKIQDISDKIRGALSIVDEVTLSLDKITIKNAPLTSHRDLQDLSQFLTINFYAANFTLNAFRYQNHMPGFKISYQENDTPFRFNSNLSGFSISMNMAKGCHSGELRVLKVLDTPNISLFGSTNLFSQRFDFQSGQLLQNAVCNLKGHISSPNFDMDVEHLSIFKCFKKNIKVFTGALKRPNECAPNRSIHEKSRSMLNYLKVIVPLVDIKFTVEDLKVVVSDKDEFLIHKLSAFILNFRTNRYICQGCEKNEKAVYDVDSNLEILGLKSQHIDKKMDYKRTIISLESIRVHSDIKLVPDILLATQVDLDTLEINLSDLPTMMMINRIYRKADSQILEVEDNYFIHYYERFAEKLRDAERQCIRIGKHMKSKKVLPREFFFKELPLAFDYVKVDVKDVVITLGARSVFMPASVFSNLESQSPDDFVNGELRKYRLKVDKIQMALYGNKTQWHSRIETGRTTMTKSAQAPLYQKCGDRDLDDISTSDATEVEHTWNFNILLNNTSSSVISETLDKTDELSTRKISKLTVLSIKIFPEATSFEGDDSRRIIVQLDNKRLKSVLSLGNLFLIISGIHTLKQVFSLDVCSHRKESLAKKHFLALSLKKQKGFFKCLEWSDLKTLIQFNFSSEVITQILVLPNGLPARFDILSTFISFRNFSEISLTGQNFRMSVESPMRKNYWVRMITVLHYSINADISQLKDQMNKQFRAFDSISPGIILENESWHFNIPHEFEMYKIFDNIPTIFKSMKQMIHSFRSTKEEIVISPSTVKTPSLPKIWLKSKRGILTIDDDPFEADLNMIFQIGLKEQRSRLAKLEEMDQCAAAKILSKGSSKMSKSESFEEIRKCDILGTINTVKRKFRFRRSKTHSHVGQNALHNDKSEASGKPEELISPDIEAAYERLLENFSTSWIGRIKEYKLKEKKLFEENFSFLWGNVNYSKLPADINQRVLPITTNPSLTTLIIEGIDIMLFHPSCGVEKIPEFINEIGKGVPKNFEYSIMVPMYLDAKFKEIRWHLRDYPLPFVYIPALNSSQSRAKPDIHFHGNLVISEDMIQSKREIRSVFVPLVPAVIEDSDTYYSLQVPRTITSLKFFTDLQLDINSSEATQVTWGGGYQPAIQQTMQCFDNFSKPPLDPSPKIGFWDKVRYLFHARIRISWKNNGKFEVSLKGGQSPYKVGADSAGFIVGFSGNVLLDCNENDDPQKFMSCTAEKVHFSIPNYFAQPFLVWSKPSDQRVFVPTTNDSNLQEYASFYYLVDLDRTNKEKANINKMSSYYIEKTGIKLTGGVTLNIGMVFERLVSGKKERTLSSVPHYDVRLSNHLYVDDINKHDSYAGFRSDFIHLAFSLLSSSDSAYNAMQLSPGGLRTFKQWWKAFAGTFPVRMGKLFGEQSVSPKFGEHLYSISYVADVSPLFITHVTHSIDVHALKQKYFDTAEFAGLKAKASHFVMDLHQRKEVLLEYQEELEKTKRVMRLKFLEAEVSVFEIDLRTVYAKLNRVDYVEEKSDSKFDIFDDDMSWYDITDFKESNYIDVENYVPDVRIKPMLYSPQFIYIKHALYGDKFQVDPKSYKRIKPFKNNLSHGCSIGRPPSLPFKELEKRYQILNDFKEKTENSLKSKGSKMKLPSLEDTLGITTSAMKNVTSLIEDLRIVDAKRSDKLNAEEFTYPIMNMMYDTSKSNVNFENRYYICNMLLKWNEETRDVVYKFLHNFNLANDLSNLSAQKCMHFFEKIVKQRETSEEEQKEFKNVQYIQKKLDSVLNGTDDELLDEALLKMFEENISELGLDLDHSVQLKHIVHFITPQIQLITEEDPDSCTIVTAPSIKLKTLSFFNNDLEGQYNEDMFMKRFGLHLTNANLFRFHKEDYTDYLEVFFDTSSYGQSRKHQWPPWLGMELCFEPDNLSSEAIIKNFSSILFCDRVSQFSRVYSLFEDKLQNSITGYLPRIVMSSDSKSYLSIYKMVTNLLIFIEPEDAELQKQIEKLTIGLDPEDIAQMEVTITDLHKSLRILNRVEEEFLFKRQLLDDADIVDLSNVRNEKVNHLLRLYIFMKVFSSNKKWSDNADHSLLWNFYLKEIILHMLDDHRKPFVDVAIAKLHFERSESTTGFNNNAVTVHMAQAFDLQEGAVYQDLLGPFYGKESKNVGRKANEPLVSIAWEMDKPIGGIKVIKHVKTNLSDLTLCLEESAIQKVLTWFFPDELNLQPADNEDDEPSMSVANIDPDRLDAYMNLSLQKDSDVHEMIQRSTDYVIIENLVLNTFRLCISFKGSGALRLINVTNFIFSFPELVYENQTIRIIDLLVDLKKILIRDVLKHTAKFIGAKVRNRPPDRKPSMGSPLKQLTSYDSYMKSQDLEE